MIIIFQFYHDWSTTNFKAWKSGLSCQMQKQTQGNIRQYMQYKANSETWLHAIFMNNPIKLFLNNVSSSYSLCDTRDFWQIV